MSRPTNGELWTLLLGSGAVLEARSLFRGDDGTLCGFTRAVFHTDTPEGRAAFTAVLIAAGVGFWRHILKKELRS